MQGNLSIQRQFYGLQLMLVREVERGEKLGVLNLREGMKVSECGEDEGEDDDFDRIFCS
jgi:hypothetical protein